MTASLAWVIGRGGLLGRHVESALEADDADADLWRPKRPIAWLDAETALADLEFEATAFLAEAARLGRPWRLLWCAGAGVLATSSRALSQETLLLSRFLPALADRLSSNQLLAAAGSLFFASSAGGVYAASRIPPPFDELSPVGALAPYGREKLTQEALFSRLASSSGVDLLIGRFSNLYGPGQNLSKPQGLIAHVGGAALRHEPVSIYVPLDTIRDYLFAADAGRMVVEAIKLRETSRRGGAPPRTTIKIFASEVETTVASVLRAWRQVLRRPLRISFSGSPVGRLQPRVLSFRSRVWPELRGQPTLLQLGVDTVRRDQLARLMRGAASGPAERGFNTVR
jgi:NAD dependent epimerase/dehydratase family